MATQSQVLSDTPVNIASTLGLAAGTTVSVQNVGIGDVFVAEAANEPDPSASPPAHVLEHLKTLGVEVANEGIWVWSPGRPGRVAVTEQ